MPSLMLDPNALLTKLQGVNPADYIQSGNPMIDAARQRLQQSQQGLLQQNAMLQQQALQRKAEQQQLQQMRRQAAAIAAANSIHGLSGAGTPSSGYTTAGPAPKGQVYNWINQALQITGHTGGAHDRLVNGLYNMIMRESGGNPYAKNGWDSNAKAGTPSIGLMQTIQPTFDAYALAGHRTITNPIDNIIAGLRYALSRYGMRMVEAGGRHDANGNYIGY